MDWEVSLQVGASGPSHSMPGGWYIEDPADSFLLGNLPINGLDEWDVSKLGWFKSRSPTENHMDSTGEQIIRQAFKVQVENCALNSYKYQVHFQVPSFPLAKLIIHTKPIFPVLSRIYGPQSAGRRSARGDDVSVYSKYLRLAKACGSYAPRISAFSHDYAAQNQGK